MRFAAAGAASVVVSRSLSVHGLPGIVVTGGLVGCIYLALMWPLLMDAPLGPYVRRGTAAALGVWRGGTREPAVEPRA